MDLFSDHLSPGQRYFQIQWTRCGVSVEEVWLWTALGGLHC